MSASADVVIVGGGIWGLSAAYHVALRNPGRRIVVVERGSELAGETTRQAAGQIGQLRANAVMARAVGYTLDLLSRFRDQTGHDPALRKTGSLHLALNEQRAAAFEAQMAVACRLGIEIESASDRLIARIAPEIDRRRLCGAIFVPNDAYVDARACALAYGAAARDLGVEVQLSTRLTGFAVSNGRVTGIETSGGRFDAQHVVVTVGPWARQVIQSAGFAAPAQPIRLQQARTSPHPHLPANHPVVRIPDHSCYLRPEKGGYLFGYFDPEPMAIDLNAQSDDFVTADIAPCPELVAESTARLQEVFPRLGELPIAEYRQGMVACTPDAHYVLGPVPGCPGLLVATGCGAMGIAGSGAVGRWISRWLTDGHPGEDPEMFSPTRFGPRAADADWVRDECRRVYANYYALAPGSNTYSIGAQIEG